jgi:hypothetical protein
MRHLAYIAELETARKLHLGVVASFHHNKAHFFASFNRSAEIVAIERSPQYPEKIESEN